MNRLDEIKARLDEFDRHKDASMNERDPETYAYIRALVPIKNHAVVDERYMLSKIASLTAELDAMTAENLQLVAKMGEQAGQLAAMTAERDEMRERAEAAERDINCMLRDVNPFVRCKACGMLAGFGCVAEICAKEAYWRGPVKNKEGV